MGQHMLKTRIGLTLREASDLGHKPPDGWGPEAWIVWFGLELWEDKVDHQLKELGLWLI